MIEFNIRNRDTQLRGPKRFIRVRREGWLYDVPNLGEIEVFRIGTLAEAVDRKVETIVAWENDGLIPQPLFAVYGSKWRLYSDVQITNVHRLAVARLKGRRYVPREELDNFFDEIWSVWYEPEVIVLDNGAISPNSLRLLKVRPAPGKKRPVSMIDAVTGCALGTKQR